MIELPLFSFLEVFLVLEHLGNITANRRAFCLISYPFLNLV